MSPRSRSRDATRYERHSDDLPRILCPEYMKASTSGQTTGKVYVDKEGIHDPEYELFPEELIRMQKEGKYRRTRGRWDDSGHQSSDDEDYSENFEFGSDAYQHLYNNSKSAARPYNNNNRNSPSIYSTNLPTGIRINQQQLHQARSQPHLTIAEDSIYPLTPAACAQIRAQKKAGGHAFHDGSGYGTPTRSNFGPESEYHSGRRTSSESARSSPIVPATGLIGKSSSTSSPKYLAPPLNSEKGRPHSWAPTPGSTFYDDGLFGDGFTSITAENESTGLQPVSVGSSAVTSSPSSASDKWSLKKKFRLSLGGHTKTSAGSDVHQQPSSKLATAFHLPQHNSSQSSQRARDVGVVMGDLQQVGEEDQFEGSSSSPADVTLLGHKLIRGRHHSYPSEGVEYDRHQPRKLRKKESSPLRLAAIASEDADDEFGASVEIIPSPKVSDGRATPRTMTDRIAYLVLAAKLTAYRTRKRFSLKHGRPTKSPVPTPQ